MTGHKPGNPGYDDGALDDVIDAAMSGTLAKLEAAFSPDGGLADIYARSRLHPARPGQEPRPHGNRSSRLEQVCDQIDLITGLLADLIRSGQQVPFGGSSFVELARDALVQLRAGLASRTMARPEAQRLTTSIQNQLGQADQILRSRHATTLDHLANQISSLGALTEHIDVLREMVVRLYAPDGNDRSLVPAR